MECLELTWKAGTMNNRVCMTCWLNIIQVGVAAADGILRRNCRFLDKPKHMVLTWPETGARLLVTRFFKSSIEIGYIIYLIQVATRANLGLADAFIHGDFSFVDKNKGLLNLIMIFIANKELKASITRSSKKRVMNSSNSFWMRQ